MSKTHLSNVQRIYPESKTGLINWIEENFHELDEFVFLYQMKDGSHGNYYDAYSCRNALGMLEMAKEGINDAYRNDEFVEKQRT